MMTIFNDTTRVTLHPEVEEVPNFDSSLTIFIIVTLIICCLIIVTNLTVVLSSGLILKKGISPKATYLFVGNIAMSDLGFGVSVVFGMLAGEYPGSFNSHTQCAIQLGTALSSSLVSRYTVGLISIDRFLYIVYGMKYKQWMYTRRARWLVVFTWLFGILFGFLPAAGFWTNLTKNGKVCRIGCLAPPVLILLILFVAMLPSLIATVLYSIILYYAIKKEIQRNSLTFESIISCVNDKDGDNKNYRVEDLRMFRGGNFTLNGTVQQQERINSPSKIKAINVVLFTCGPVCSTWISHFSTFTTYFLYDPAMSDPNDSISTRGPFLLLALFNLLLNPLIYAWWHNGFRNFTKDIFCRRRNPSETSKNSDYTTTKSSVSSLR